jgi:hypothetical protein
MQSSPKQLGPAGRRSVGHVVGHAIGETLPQETKGRLVGHAVSRAFGEPLPAPITGRVVGRVVGHRIGEPLVPASDEGRVGHVVAHSTAATTNWRARKSPRVRERVTAARANASLITQEPEESHT